MNYPISVFGLQTGAELLARIRFLYGALGLVAVDDTVSNVVSTMTVPQAAKFLAETEPHLRLVDVQPRVGMIYRDELYDDSVGMFRATFVSLVQPASSVDVTLPADEMRAFILDLNRSGMYECIEVGPA